MTRSRRHRRRNYRTPVWVERLDTESDAAPTGDGWAPAFENDGKDRGDFQNLRISERAAANELHGGGSGVVYFRYSRAWAKLVEEQPTLRILTASNLVWSVKGAVVVDEVNREVMATIEQSATVIQQ